jgi:RpiR family transcriptional regulator, carbohydrate utilization regulator
MNNDMSCLITLKSLYPSMHDVEKRISDYILSHSEIVVNMTVAQISKETGVADSSIVRLCQRLGFDGFTQFKVNLAKNQKRPEEIILEDISAGDDPYTVTSKVFRLSGQALKDTVEMLDKGELNKAVDAIMNARRMEFYGVGSSAPLAMDAYYRFMRIGLPAYVAVDPHISRISANLLDPDCLAIGISHTGRTIDTVRALEIAKGKGAKTLCITSYLDSPITEVSDIKLIISAVETRFMKEAIASRIAQIALLDSLYTCVALRKCDKVVENIEDMTEILNEMRY